MRISADNGQSLLEGQFIDFASSHKTTVVKFSAKNSTSVIDQASYSPDLAPSDVFLFPKLKLPYISQ